MLTLVRQELYKLFHKTGTWVAMVIMVAIQVAFAIAARQLPDIFNATALFNDQFVGGELVIFLAIALTASIIAMEFQYGTIRQLLYRRYYRSQVFVSKVITVLIGLVLMEVLSNAVTWALKFGLFPQVDLNTKVNGGRTLLVYYAQNLGATLLTTLLLLSLVLLLATLFKSNAAAIVTGIIGYFVASLAGSFLVLLIGQYEWVKWNPFTMLMLANQVDTPSYAQLTMLSTPVMIGCSLGYTVVLGCCAYLSFRHRSV
ncbi:ABC transporter permease [Lacticaseibacillus thailandensis]|uniref:ABC transporter permease n=1 Tax=Lacticaseibacillus thailandensis DSM 22698 = JCM 13996 TaxID=1423810 RepID=A0A0R2CDS6_9LACO|nr:ABC transporter permease [Lacticaseibacillus thailandensis]KRM86537.1 hypothetical protein FD19_GL001850 [Lacticaseibacillus thailandensis DSM 22698 = JCM 13996]